MKKSILTNSALKLFADCPRLYELAIERLIKPLLPGEALVCGDAIHKGLEAWWKAAKEGPCKSCDGAGYEVVVPRLCQNQSDVEQQSCSECLGQPEQHWLRAAFDALPSDPPDPFRRATLEALLIGYHERWKAMRWEGAPYDGAPIEVLSVEQEFTGPMFNPETGSPSKTWQRGGKIDALIRVAGQVWVLEHKSSSEDFSPGSPYRQRLRLDTQVSGYHVGARILGHTDVAGVLYDVVGKFGLKPLKATPPEKRKWTKPTKSDPVSRLYAGQRETDETPDEYQQRVLDDIASGGYYARFEVVRLAHEENAAAKDTWNRASEIRDARRLKRWPRNPGACSKYGRSCAYLPICTGDATENDGTRYRKAETAHEELSGGHMGNGQEKQAA